MVLIPCGFIFCVNIVGVIDGDKETEAGLHKLFSAVSLRGEWFKPNQAIFDYIALHAKPADLLSGVDFRPGYSIDFRGKMLEIELALINQALSACGGNKSRAAKMLGITRPTLSAKLARK